MRIVPVQTDWQFSLTITHLRSGRVAYARSFTAFTREPRVLMDRITQALVLGAWSVANQ